MAKIIAILIICFIFYEVVGVGYNDSPIDSCFKALIECVVGIVIIIGIIMLVIAIVGVVAGINPILGIILIVFIICIARKK